LKRAIVYHRDWPFPRVLFFYYLVGNFFPTSILVGSGLDAASRLAQRFLRHVSLSPIFCCFVRGPEATERKKNREIKSRKKNT
jgi:hypothetical protein